MKKQLIILSFATCVSLTAFAISPCPRTLKLPLPNEWGTVQVNCNPSPSEDYQFRQGRITNITRSISMGGYQGTIHCDYVMPDTQNKCSIYVPFYNIPSLGRLETNWKCTPIGTTPDSCDCMNQNPKACPFPSESPTALKKSR